MPDPVSRLRLARDEIDKTFGVGFAASRACCRRLGGRLTAPPTHRNQWPPFVRCGAGAGIAGTGLDELIAVASKLCQWSGPWRHGTLSCRLSRS